MRRSPHPCPVATGATVAARGDTTTTSLKLALPEPDSLISAGEMVRDSDDIAELTSKAAHLS